MPVNLANVSISLDQFQRISSGKYNAGEVKLSGETSLAKINNHVFLRGKNIQTVSHEETLAIKEAFVRALASSGVGKDAVNAVRRELGLAPDGIADKTLGERSMKPLSRQQIREILDRNATAINAFKGDGTIRTDAEIHSGYRSWRVASFVARREATNAALGDTRELTESASIAFAQSVAAGDVDFCPSSDRKQLLEAALAQKAEILARSKGNPSTAANGSFTLKFGGVSVEINPGISEAAYVEKLDDMIVRLRSNFCPSDRDVSAYKEFRALPDDAARVTWASGLAADARTGGLKARAAAVMLLKERGIDDHETLSLVNRIDDADAQQLLSALVGGERSLSGNALRQSPTLRALIAKSATNPAAVPDAAKTYIPALSARDFNYEISSYFNADTGKLPESFAKMAREVRDEVAARLGADAVPKKGSIDGLMDYDTRNALIKHDAATTQRVTPASIRSGFLAGALISGARLLLAERVKDAATRLGAPVGTTRAVSNALVAQHPNLLSDLAACKTPAEVDGVLASIANDFDAAVKVQSAIERCSASAKASAIESIAEKMHVPAAVLQNPGAMDLSALSRMCKSLGEKIGNRTVAASTPAEVEAAFRDMVANYVKGRIQILGDVDTLPLSRTGRDNLREQLIAMNKTDYVDLSAVMSSARQLDFGPLIALISGNAPADKVYAAMNEIAGKAINLVPQTLSAAKGEIGPEDRSYARLLILAAAADLTPGAETALAAFFARPDVPQEQSEPGSPSAICDIFRLAVPTGLTGGRIADTLAHPGELPLLYAQALAQSCPDAGIDVLTPAEALDLFAPGKPAGDALASALAAHQGNLHPNTLRQLAADALRPHASAILERHAAETAFRDGSFERGFIQGAGTATALGRGYFRREIPGLARAFAFCRAAGLSEDDAMSAVMDPASNPMRLFRYGGRFTESPAAFRNGLALMDSFSSWFAQTIADDKNAQTPTAANMNFGVVTSKAKHAVEKFVFEEIAFNPALPLDAADPESVFGMANNPATRFAGRNFTRSFTNSLAQIPPARRQLLYAVFDTLNPLAQTRDEADQRDHLITDTAILAARVLKHYDAIAALQAAGNLDRAHLIALLYSDMRVSSDADNGAINDTVGTALYSLFDPQPGGQSDLMGRVQLTMELSGASIQDCTDAVRNGRQLPPAPGNASINGGLESLDGTPSAGRKQLLDDLLRPSPHTDVTTERSAMPLENNRFVFVFPNSEPIIAKAGSAQDEEVVASGNDIADRVENLCGKVHPAQLSAVFFALSQSGLGQLNRGLLSRGISSNEHSPVTFSLSKNEETGAITIRYSEPPGLPLHFHWETTIDLDGKATSTPLVID